MKQIMHWSEEEDNTFFKPGTFSILQQDHCVGS